MALVQINDGWHWRKMKETRDRFEAKKLGGAFYLIRLRGGEVMRHLAVVVESTSEVECPSLPSTPQQA
jgi:hypothetical protein